MSFELGLLVDVYKNLHKDCWSVRAAEGENKGRVVGYADSIFLTDATFVVQKGGRERVRREKRKNVHAWIRGRIANSGETAQSITYDPYKYDTFVFREGEKPIHQASLVWLKKDSSVEVSQ